MLKQIILDKKKKKKFFDKNALFIQKTTCFGVFDIFLI